MPEKSGQQTISQDLDRACAQEPIHIIGTVQPHGFVLVVDIHTTRIVQVSSGIARHWVGLGDASRLLQQKLADWVDGLGKDPAAQLRGLPRSDPVALELQPRQAAPGLSFECVAHRIGEVALLEWQLLGEDAEVPHGGTHRMIDTTSALVRLREAKALDAFFADCVREVARVCQFHRVMLYRFLPDWTGEVIAEEAAGELKTRFLGLRFPATDIPSQARALYTSSKIRLLADVQAVPDMLLPATLPGGGPLDQSHSLLRGFSEVHKTYLGNMGVRATMSLSIVCDGKLWGLIACHHYQPRVPPYHVRNTLRRLCELMAEVIAMRIETLAQLESAHEAVTLDQLLLNFHQSVLQEEDTKAVLARLLPELLAAFQASSFCVRIGDLVYVGGETLTSASDSDILDELAARFPIAPPAAGVVQRTDLLTPNGGTLLTLPLAAGLLAVRRSTDPLEICAFTRPEVAEEVDWAGAPAKELTVAPDGQVRLEPRRSFDLWKETVAGTSRSWSASDTDACEQLLRILSDACERHQHKARDLELRFRVHQDHLASLQRANSNLEREVVERVRAQDNLRQVNETLEVRVADRTAQLAALTRQQGEEAARFAIAADAAGLGFWDFDIAANALNWDERMFRLYGHSPMQGDQPYSLWSNSLHPDDRVRSEQEYADALNGKRAYDTEFRIVHPNGAIRHLKAAARIARDADGRAIRMFGVNFDITARKHADEQFRLAIEAAPAGMLLMNSSGSIALVNIQIENLFGYPRAELLGRDADMLLPVRMRAHPILRNSIFRVPRTRAMGPGEELYGLRKDGSEVPIEIELNPLHTSEGEFVLCSVVDLSQRRDMERLRTDFVSTVSHELRTPLTSISGSLGLLQSGVMGALPDKATEMVRIAYNNSGRLVRIINDILDIGKLESGRSELRLQSAPLAELLRQSVEANSSYAEKCGVRFLLDEDSANVPVLVDPDRFMQVLANLLSNAAKFSPTGADVLIRVRTSAAKIRVEVEDHGQGIPETFQARVFEKFAQADSSTTRRFEGTGLGLSIARKLIEAMGGSIGFTTRVGHGTIFSLELPRLDAAATALRGIQPREDLDGRADITLPVDRVAAKNKVPRLLYLEDDEDLITVIRETLAGRADIVAAHTVRDAERLLGEDSFELIILDQALPDGNGISLVDRIPGIVGHPVPIVILSAADVPNEMHRKVAAVIAKSEASAAHVATTILSYLPLPHA